MSSPYLTMLTGDLWLMEAAALQRLATLLTDPKLQSIVPDPAAAPAPGYDNRDGIAHISVSGTLMKTVPAWMAWYGIDATSYQDVARALDDAEADPNVTAIMLDIDSPGGQAAGIHAMADRIAATQKPVYAHIDTLGASAAYWMASQADQITAGRGSQIGSIGAYTVRVDLSRMAENDGIIVHLVSSGVHKGSGYPGTAISKEQLAEVQASIDALAKEFVIDVAGGRGRTANDIQPSADGRIFSAADAQARGLIDRITSDPAKDLQMAKDAATEKAYLKSGLALCREFPGHAGLIEAALEKETAIETIRGDIAIAEKSRQDAAEKAALVAEVALGKTRLENEQAAHEATKATLVSVQRERDALALLKNGTGDAHKVKADPAAHTVPKVLAAAAEQLKADGKGKEYSKLMGQVARGEVELVASL
jgi:signal peptide peptidase SppA